MLQGIDVAQRGQYRERTGVPARAARVGWWMRPGFNSCHALVCPENNPVATAPGTDKSH